MVRARKNRGQLRQPAVQKQTKTVFSYHSSRSDSNVKIGRQNTEKHSRVVFILRHLPVVFAAMALIISLGYLLTLSSNPKIVSVNGDTAALLRKQTDYSAAAKKLLGGSIANKSKITINVNRFETDMKKQFPELGHVAVILPIMGRRPIVKLEAASPALVLNVENDDSYLVDKNGRIIMKASEADQAKIKNIPVITDKSKLKAGIGQGILTADETRFIATILSQLKAKNIGVESMTLPVIASELHVKIAGQPYYVKFDLQGDGKVQVGTFLAVKSRLEADKTQVGEYIDVRVEEKAYFR